MKQFLPFSLAFLLAACVTTPQDKQADHQRELWKEAQANFLALKTQAHPNRPPAPTPAPQLAVQRPQKLPDRPHPSPTPSQHLFASQPPKPAQKQPPQKPQPQKLPPSQRTAKATPKPPTKVAAQPKPKPNPSQRTAGNQNETLYYWQVPPPPKGNSARFQVAEAKYARVLAKRPENLTPEERVWAHEHF